jgi:hypothetical protein
LQADEIQHDNKIMKINIVLKNIKDDDDDDADGNDVDD